MRVVAFAGPGTFSAPTLERLAADQDLATIVLPRRKSRSRITSLRGRIASATGLDRRRWSRSLRNVRVRYASRGDIEELAARLSRLSPDLICIVGYPWILPATLYRTACHGAINLHASLLPRHRGILPLFWIYHSGDEHTGITVHRVAETADSGEILEQQQWPLARGFPVEQLNRINAERGAEAVMDVLARIERGADRGVPQDEMVATHAPAVLPGMPMVEFREWDVGQVWHFLRGLFPRFKEPLTLGGRPLMYQGVGSFTREKPGHPPGTVIPDGRLARLTCADGYVELEL